MAGLQSKQVVMSNSLNRSAMGLNLAEKRIVACALAKMSGVNSLTKISAKEYAETFQMPINQAYEQMKETAKGMVGRAVTVFMKMTKLVKLLCIRGFRLLVMKIGRDALVSNLIVRLLLIFLRLQRNSHNIN